MELDQNKKIILNKKVLGELKEDDLN